MALQPISQWFLIAPIYYHNSVFSCQPWESGVHFRCEFNWFRSLPCCPEGLWVVRQSSNMASSLLIAVLCTTPSTGDSIAFRRLRHPERWHRIVSREGGERLPPPLRWRMREQSAEESSSFQHPTDLRSRFFVYTSITPWRLRKQMNTLAH